MDDAQRQHFLAIYLNDHLAGATAGSARFARAARSHRGTQAGEVLARLSAEVAQDERTLAGYLERLGVQRRLTLQLAGRAGEVVGALKPNGRFLKRSPLSTLVELEVLGLGVQGKAAGWLTLRELALVDDRLDAEELELLVERARRQAAELERLRRASVAEVLGRGGDGGGTSTVPPQAG